jgi:T6SS, Phospholipase effector Tle1-like, catalytic domain
MWFAGVHSDVGGQFPDDHELSDIALGWMADEAIATGLRVDNSAYEKLVGAPPGTSAPLKYSLGKIHANSLWWVLAGFGWHRRTIRPGDHIHPSVRQRVKETADSTRPHRP